jgi:hypothetical protein
MFGVERGHFIPFVGLARHNRKTMHFMEVFRERQLVRHLPGGLLLSLYNASILVVAFFAFFALFTI